MIIQIVEYNYINLRCLHNILSKIEIEFDIQIIECSDGDLSVENFKKHNKLKNNQNIQLIIIDFNMIKMNGDVAAKQVFFYLKIKDLVRD